MHYKGLEQLQGHPLGQPALVHLELWAHHDHRASAVVHTFAQQVLAETSLFAAQQVGQGLKLVVVAALDGAAPAAVVDQCVHGLLQHAFFIPDDDLRRAQRHEPLQPVVAVDHPAIEVIQVACSEPTAI